MTLLRRLKVSLIMYQTLREMRRSYQPVPTIVAVQVGAPACE